MYDPCQQEGRNGGDPYCDSTLSGHRLSRSDLPHPITRSADQAQIPVTRSSQQEPQSINGLQTKLQVN